MYRLNPQHFRGGLIHCWYIFFLPLIVHLQWILNKDIELKPADSDLLCMGLWSSVPTLLSYRFGVDIGSMALISGTVCVGFNMFGLSNKDVVLLWLTNIFILQLLRSLPVRFTRCFTFAELSIIVQPLLICLMRIVKFNLASLGLLSASGNSISDESLICLACYSSLLVALVLSTLPLENWQKSLFYLILIPLQLYIHLHHLLQGEPISWLLEMIIGNEQRTKLFIWWLVVMLLTCAFTYVHTYHTRNATTTVTRKVFHLAISIIYLLGIAYNVHFLEFVSKLVLFAFLYLEIIRVNNIRPIGSALEQVFVRFRDEKDCGVLTLTHIYLLVGCSMPLWLSRSLNSDSALLLASGVITVGVGDTFASLGGFYFGRHRWPNSRKTFEGTFCAWLSQVIIMLFISHFSNYWVQLSLSYLFKVAMITLCSSLMETFTNQVDNLVLPPLQYALTLLILG